MFEGKMKEKRERNTKIQNTNFVSVRKFFAKYQQNIKHTLK